MQTEVGGGAAANVLQRRGSATGWTREMEILSPTETDMLRRSGGACGEGWEPWELGSLGIPSYQDDGAR